MTMTETTALKTQPVVRWARWAAHVAALTTLPSGLWRVALAAGLPVGYSPAAARTLFDAPGPGSIYLIGLSVVLEGLALLTLGLVQPWGEVVPHWIPFLGGRRVAPMAAVIPAAAGAVALTFLWGTVAISWWFTPRRRRVERLRADSGWPSLRPTGRVGSAAGCRDVRLLPAPPRVMSSAWCHHGQGLHRRAEPRLPRRYHPRRDPHLDQITGLETHLGIMSWR